MEPENKNLKNLTDRGWQEMRGLLDREMPEEKRVRPAAFWFWTAGAAIFVAGFSFLMMKNQQPAAPKTEKLEVPVAVRSENLPGEDFSKNEKLEKLTAIPAAGKLSTFEKPRSPQIPPSAQFSKNGDSFSISAVSFRRNLPKIDTQFLILEGGNRADSYGMTPVELKSEGLPAVENSPNFENLKNPKLAALPFLPTETHFLKKETAPPSPEKLAFEPMTKKLSTKTDWHFGLTAGAIFSNFPKPNGVAAGFSVNKKLGKKWEIRTGLQYQYLKYQFSDGLAVSTKIDGNQYLDLTGDTLKYFLNSATPGNLDLDSASFDLIIPVSGLHRLELPFQIAFFPAKKWPVFAGVSVSRTVGSRTDFVLAGTSKNVVPSADAVAKMNDFLKKNIADWDVFWQAGIGFKASKQLEINLLMRKNFKNKQSKANWQSQNFSNLTAADASYFESKSLKNYNLSDLTKGKFVPEIQLGLRWQLR